MPRAESIACEVALEGLQVAVDAQVFIAGTVNLRVEIAFQGYLIVIAPPTETR